jgi:3-phenylpropionate/trans-cinnamate dioxygenase ferredoxin subunit
MATEVFVAQAADMPPGSRRIVQHDNLQIGVFNLDGRFYALPNVCIHQFGPLCEGRLSGTLIATAASGWRPEWVQEGEILKCPWHSLEFDITTGRCLGYPGRRLRSYPVKVAGGQVMLVL